MNPASAAAGAPAPDRTRLKVCGLRDVASVAAAVAAGADAIGFVVAAGSPREVATDAMPTLLAAVPPGVTAVCVLRDQPDHPSLARPGIIAQLHGDEDEAACAAARAATGRPVIRGVAWDPDAIARWDACPDVGVLLVDGPRPGSGERFDHAALAAMRPTLGTPIALAGGLDPATVGPAIAAVRPWMVDVSSGVESARGVKDPARIRAFAAAVRAADASLA
jgi:phosphoribosylanthranilate isomerase